MPNHALALVKTSRASQQDGSHPRPTLLREGWLSLDRLVGFAHDDAQVGLDEHWERTEAPFDRQIQLPFAPETEASGIDEKGFHPCVWYRIVVTSDDLRCAGHADGRRLLLHLGAVDHEAMVFVDGTLVGSHTGGQTAFSLDITSALDPQAGEHVITVRALEDPLETRQPRGKQDWMEEPHVIWYHRTTGIWRTVWLESVPPLHISRLVWRSDVPNGSVTAHVEFNRRPEQPVELDLAVGHEGRVLAAGSVLVDQRACQVTLELSGQNNGVNYEQLLWQPGQPTLLDTAAVLHTEVPDQVTGYLGFRDVAVGADRMELNFRPAVLRSVLEQGYWPSSHLTPPSLQAMREEVQLILDLGFNSARIHQKVEDPRLVFWADKLGLTLWGEAAAAYSFDSLAVQWLTQEWVEIVRAYEGHPSIIAWVPFNESWGVTHLARDEAQQAYTRGLSDLVRALDPTRPVVSNDGWEHTDSDLLTIHDYEWQGEILAARYTDEGLERMLGTSGPAGRAIALGTDQAFDIPVILTEFGGVEFVTAPSADQTWGYSSARDAEDFEKRVREIMDAVKASPILGGYCWTQLTDTLQEANGLCDENRVPKLPVETLKELMGA
ncbi:glycoside hydrolase family 2 TIM barrel-domain containing protein [Luteococcus peritonei]|uniref:Glycoside hydrolase family 2 TIM barrel-domain containing protein n=1 Tax=Luteococcus peritonei TaxID=88874 RepID=A0ABW4RS73_9ACTN